MKRGRPTFAFALFLAFSVTGSLAITYGPGSSNVDPESVEVVFGALSPGSNAGLNLTRATATLTGALVATTTDIWYVNNTNTTGASYVKLVLTNAPTATGITTLTIGIDNGTATVDGILASLGAVTQTEGAYLRLDPGASGRIYATHLVTVSLVATQFDINVKTADGLDGAAVVTTRANLTLT